MTLIWIDTETGGLDPSYHSLLTLALVLRSPNGERETLTLAFQHKSYIVDAEAMSINHIDLVAHHQAALPPDLAIALLESFLDRHENGEKVVLAGHNVTFDIAFMGSYLRSNGGGHLLRRFSHRSVDTMSLATAFQAAGWLPEVPLGLTALLGHYGVECLPQARHTALGDAMATAQLFDLMVASLRRDS